MDRASCKQFISIVHQEPFFQLTSAIATIQVMQIDRNVQI